MTVDAYMRLLKEKLLLVRPPMRWMHRSVIPGRGSTRLTG
mgnify:CR=1 FL=1|jgi:hypothetical protein